MNKQEVSEIKKQFKLDNVYLTPGKTYNAYISEQGEIIWDRFIYFDRLEEEDITAYYNIFKKTLSGGLGKNLNEYKFDEDIEDNNKDLNILLDSFEEESVKSFVQKLIETLVFPFRWYVTFTQFIYSVPPKKRKGKKESTEPEDFVDYKFMICSINTMEKKETGLAWSTKDNNVSYLTNGLFAASKGPICGFLYPLFNDRNANNSGFLSYSKDKTTPCIPLVVDVLNGKFELSPCDENALFHKVLKETCGGAIKFGLAKDICSEISNIVKGNFEETEAPKIGIAELQGILTRNGMVDLTEKAEEEWKNTFGSNNIQILATSVTDEKKTIIKAPDVSISLTNEKTCFVEEKIVNGVKCIVIPITDGGVTINEMDIEP